MKAEQKSSKDGQRPAGSDEGEERPEAASGLIVKRERLLRDLAGKGREAGISIVNAPTGFGKTALLLQYANTVANDPSRGAARVVNAASMDAATLGTALEKCLEELPKELHPLVAIDDLPIFEDEVAMQLVTLLRAMREKGFEVVVACSPENRVFISAMGDSHKVGAQALTVHPREYSEWARTFSIARTLDVYELTQGIPSLVVLLQSVTGNRSGFGVLERGIMELYAQILDPLRRLRDPLYRICCMLLLLGKGVLADLERCGVRMNAESIARLARDYPVFGLDADRTRFSCMGTESMAMLRLRKEIAGHRSGYAPKAVRALLRSGRVDEAVGLAEALLDTEGSLEVIAQHPTEFALSGNAVFVHRTVARLNGEDVARAPTGVILSVYLCALTMGEYRLARAMCAALRSRAHELEGAVDQGTWAIARAMGDVWDGCNGTTLPRLSEDYERPSMTGDAFLLKAHQAIYREILGGDGGPLHVAYPNIDALPSDNAVNVAKVLLTCDSLLDDALHGNIGDPEACDERLQAMTERLLAQHLVPLAARVRMVAATCRLLAGLPVVDERAFVDAGNVAVRESDFPTQLFCMLGEGWQALSLGQMASARFRAQQVLKLSDDGQVFLRSWALLLERVAYVLNSSRVTLYEEADLLDLTKDQVSPARAWAVALHLSAAHFDSELSAWYSIHKDALLDERFCPLARLAMMEVGERAESIRRLLPYRVAPHYLLGDDPDQNAETPLDVSAGSNFAPIGQVSISLFGGFFVERNGHTVTDDVWRRKKASILAARLALTPGAFVGRRTITEEMWPDLPYSRARENLYAAISMLRTAFGQQDEGPQYVLTQGDGLALNSEFVSSDTSRFDMLSRDILLKRAGVSGRQIVESCLKVEQIYKGPLYVPDSGDATFFLRTQRVYLSKFIDCMLKGVDVAIDIDDLPSASWLIEAALRNEPLREDVVRHAMRVYDLSGRRREVVELYSSHLHYLEQELHTVPDAETRKAYEEIIEKSKIAAFV